MAEDKRANPYPYPTAEEVEAAPGTREQKAARNIAGRHFDGIPIRPLLMGDNDHSPMMRGIVDLTTLCYKLLDQYNASGGKDENFDELRKMLEHHGRPNAEEN